MLRGDPPPVAVELVADRGGKTPFDPAMKLGARIKAAAFARGLACCPGSGTADGVRGDHVLLAPPYVVSDGELALVVDRLGDAVEDALTAVTR